MFLKKDGTISHLSGLNRIIEKSLRYANRKSKRNLTYRKTYGTVSPAAFLCSMIAHDLQAFFVVVFRKNEV